MAKGQLNDSGQKGQLNRRDNTWVGRAAVTASRDSGSPWAGFEYHLGESNATGVLANGLDAYQ